MSSCGNFSQTQSQDGRMKSIFYQKFSNLTIAKSITLVMAVLVVSVPFAAKASQPVINGAINPREPNFFTRGREQFEKEIQLMLNRSRSALDTPLKINPQQQQRIQEQLAPLEKLPDSPSHPHESQN
jgi:hypothetical protein